MAEDAELEVVEGAEEIAEEAEKKVEEPVEGNHDFEAEALEMGWVRQDDFVGDKAKWKPAKDWVEDGKKILSVVKKQLGNEREARDRDRKAFEERTGRLEKMNADARKRDETRHKADIERLTADRAAAVESGDVDTFTQIDKQIDTLKETAPASESELSNDDRIKANETAFKEANPWYENDEVLTEYAIGVSQKILEKNPTISFEENARQTVLKVQETFPDKFKKPKPNGQSRVDGGGEFPAIPGGKKGPFDGLPSEAKTQAVQDVKDGLYKTTEEWAEVYYEK